MAKKTNETSRLEEKKETGSKHSDKHGPGGVKPKKKINKQKRHHRGKRSKKATKHP